MIRFDGIVGDGPNGTQVRAYDPHDVTVLIDGKWIKIKTNCPEDDFIIRNEADIEAIADALLQRLQDGAFRLSGFRALRYYPGWAGCRYGSDQQSGEFSFSRQALNQV